MFHFFIAFLAPLFAAATNVIDSRIANKIFERIDAVVFYSSVTNVLVIPFLFIFGRPRALTADDLPLLLLVCFLDLAYQFPFYAAMKKIDTSVAAALTSLGELSIPVLAWLIVGEKLDFWQYVGFAVIILSNLLLSVKATGRWQINAAFWLMLLASTLMALESVLLKKLLLRADWITAMFYYGLITSSLSLFLLLGRSCRRDIIGHFPAFRRQWKLFLVNEIFGQAAALAAIYAISVLPVVVFVAIDNTEPIFTLLYGAVMFYFFNKHPRERVDASALAGKLTFFMMIIIGVILVARH